MARKRHTPEQIIRRLREAEVALAQGETVARVCRSLGVAEQTIYRWRNEYGGLKLDQVKRFKQLEKDNARLRRAVADLTLDNQILREAVEGNARARPVVVDAWNTSSRYSGYPSAGRVGLWGSQDQPSAMKRSLWAMKTR